MSETVEPNEPNAQDGADDAEIEEGVDYIAFLPSRAARPVPGAGTSYGADGSQPGGGGDGGDGAGMPGGAASGGRSDGGANPSVYRPGAGRAGPGGYGGPGGQGGGGRPGGPGGQGGQGGRPGGQGGRPGGPGGQGGNGAGRSGSGGGPGGSDGQRGAGGQGGSYGSGGHGGPGGYGGSGGSGGSGGQGGAYGQRGAGGPGTAGGNGAGRSGSGGSGSGGSGSGGGPGGQDGIGSGRDGNGLSRSGRNGGPPGQFGSITTNGAGGDGLAGGAAAAAFELALAGDLAPSSYMQYLPTLYHGDAFLGRFLRIVEDIVSPLERTIDTVADSLDPRLAPSSFLPWLASWMGVDLDQNWPEAQQRELIARAATLYRWRGTRRGLREHVQIYTGRAPLIVENFTGLRLGQDACLGVNTHLGEFHPHCVYITVLSDGTPPPDEGILRRIVEASKPAHTGYLLEVRPVPEDAAMPAVLAAPADASAT